MSHEIEEWYTRWSNKATWKKVLLGVALIAVIGFVGFGALMFGTLLAVPVVIGLTAALVIATVVSYIFANILISRKSKAASKKEELNIKPEGEKAKDLFSELTDQDKHIIFDQPNDVKPHSEFSANKTYFLQNDPNDQEPSLVVKQMSRMDSLSNEVAAYEMSVALGFGDVSLPTRAVNVEMNEGYLNGPVLLQDFFKNRVSMTTYWAQVTEDLRARVVVQVDQLVKNNPNQFRNTREEKNQKEMFDFVLDRVHVRVSKPIQQIINTLSNNVNLASYQLNVLRMYILGVMHSEMSDVLFQEKGQDKCDMKMVNFKQIMPENNVMTDKLMALGEQSVELPGAISLACVLLSLPVGGEVFTHEITNFIKTHLTEAKIRALHDENNQRFKFTDKQVEAQIERVNVLVNSLAAGDLTPRLLYRHFYQQHSSFKMLENFFTYAFSLYIVVPYAFDGLSLESEHPDVQKKAEQYLTEYDVEYKKKNQEHSPRGTGEPVSIPQWVLKDRLGPQAYANVQILAGKRAERLLALTEDLEPLLGFSL